MKIQTHTEGYVGCYLHKANKKWYAQKLINKKMVCIGFFDSIDEALTALK